MWPGVGTTRRRFPKRITAVATRAVKEGHRPNNYCKNWLQVKKARHGKEPSRTLMVPLLPNVKLRNVLHL